MIIRCNHSYLHIYHINECWGETSKPSNLKLQKYPILHLGCNNSCNTFPCCMVKGSIILLTCNHKSTVWGFCLFMFGHFLLLPQYQFISQHFVSPSPREHWFLETHRVTDLSLSSLGRGHQKVPVPFQRPCSEQRKLIYTKCLLGWQSGNRNPTQTFPQPPWTPIFPSSFSR